MTSPFTLRCIRDLFRALVDENDHEVALRVVSGDRVGDVLQDRRLTSLRRGDNQRALPLTNRHDQVDHAGGEDLRLGLQAEALVRVQRGELVELGALLRLLRGHPVDGVDADELVVALAVAAVAVGVALPVLANLADYGVARAQAVLAHQLLVHVHVGAVLAVTGGADKRGVVVHDVHDAGNFLQLLRVELLVVVVLIVLVVAVVPVSVPVAAVPAAAASAAALVAVVVVVVPATAIVVLAAAAVVVVVVVAIVAIVVIVVVTLLIALVVAIVVVVLVLACAVAARPTRGRARFVLLALVLSLLALLRLFRLRVLRCVLTVRGTSGASRSAAVMPFVGVFLGCCLGRRGACLARNLPGHNRLDQVALPQTGDALQALFRRHLAQLGDLECGKIGVAACCRVTRVGHECPFVA